MAVKTSPFTGWRLSGRDADAFVKQIDESHPNVYAQDALVRGRALCKEMSEKGYSLITPNKENFFKTVCRHIKKLIRK